MPESANASFLRAAVFVRETAQVSKRHRISRKFTETHVSATWSGKLAHSSPVPWPGNERDDLASQ